jgi:ATP-dependent exoDNAse (exonuclease V) alpha subunit
MIELSKDQQSCFDIITDWFKDAGDLLTMGGYAGTGKTTLISKLRNSLDSNIRIAFCAYTGKASSVLRSKLNVVGFERFPNDYVGTIHSLIYEPVIDEMSGEIIDWALKPTLDYDFIILDEASMIGEDLFRDLKSYNLPILAIGDHGQLPPIEGKLNLMENPYIRLEKIHRFAEQDALIQISMLAREQGYIPPGTYSDTVIKVPRNHSLINKFIQESENFEDTAILCGFNKTRVSVNKRIRGWLQHTSKFPSCGERVICLKNNKNAKKCPIYNGILGTVEYTENHSNYLTMRVTIDGEPEKYKGKISPGVFNAEKPELNDFIYEEVDESANNDDEIISRFMSGKSSRRKKKKKRYLDCFDFGYSLTVHKSQGSEWDRVMVIEQPCDYWSGDKWNKWLYTAVTRSRRELLIVR